MKAKSQEQERQIRRKGAFERTAGNWLPSIACKVCDSACQSLPLGAGGLGGPRPPPPRFGPPRRPPLPAIATAAPAERPAGPLLRPIGISTVLATRYIASHLLFAAQSIFSLQRCCTSLLLRSAHEAASCLCFSCHAEQDWLLIPAGSRLTALVGLKEDAKDSHVPLRFA